MDETSDKTPAQASGRRTPRYRCSCGWSGSKADLKTHIAGATDGKPHAHAKQVDPPSRNKRWADATDSLNSAVEELRNLQSDLEDGEENFDVDEWNNQVSNVNDALSKLQDLKSEYQDWYDNLPDQLRDNSPVGEKLSTIVDIDVEPSVPDTIEDGDIKATVENADLDTLDNVVSECESAELPQGFGRD